MFEGSHIGLKKWFIAIYIFSMHKKGISSHQLASDLGITQKSAWFMLQRIRNCFGDNRNNNDDDSKMGNDGGIVEIDETYVGGQHKNKHAKERKKLNEKGTGAINKIPVFGILERQGQIKVTVLRKAEGATLKPIIRQMVSKNAIIVTDGFGGYKDLDKEFRGHEKVNHSQDEFVRGEFHTNSIEGYWSLLKRGIIGIYHHISPKHLQFYCDEFAFRYNNRKVSVNERFNYSLVSSNRITYKRLIGKA